MKKLYTIDFDMDHVLADFQKSFDEKKTDKQQFPQAEYRFFDDLEALSSKGLGDYDVLNIAYVHALIEEGHKIRIVTAPSIPNYGCWSGKAYWISKHFGEEMLKNLIITYDKSITSHDGDILVDDSIKNGQESYGDGHILYGSKEFPDMRTVYNLIIKWSEEDKIFKNK